MKKLLLLLLLPAFTFAQANTAGSKKESAKKASAASLPASAGFTINGNIQGLADGVVKITRTQGDDVVASGDAKNGVFALQGTLEEPGLYWLTLGKEQPQYIFLENAAIKITGKQADI
ncbi:MAG TPA: DUF4369 domain-containing protein, partial [Flavisolibacter sp.]|nr:DUF4369 domain-containing protein [Flavisolibacter sp.]